MVLEFVIALSLQILVVLWLRLWELLASFTLLLLSSDRCRSGRFRSELMLPRGFVSGLVSSASLRRLPLFAKRSNIRLGADGACALVSR